MPNGEYEGEKDPRYVGTDNDETNWGHFIISGKVKTKSSWFKDHLKELGIITTIITSVILVFIAILTLYLTFF